MINYRYQYPFLPVSGQVLDGTSTKTHYLDLKSLAGTVNVGIYNFDTLNIATAAGNGKKFFIGYSSEHTKEFFDKYQFGGKLPRGANYWAFKGQDVLSFEYSDPHFVANERAVIGWSGADGCYQANQKFECGKVYGVRVRVYGNEIYKRWNGDFIRDFFSDEVPCKNDTTNCVNGVCPKEYVNQDLIYKSIAKKINNDYEAQTINLKARVISSNYAAPQTYNMNIYQLVVTDDGSNHALGLVQQTVPAPFVATRTMRLGLQSVYQVCSNVTPANFTPEPLVNIPADCDDCPPTLPLTTTAQTAIAWSEICDAYRVQRTLCITLRRPECAEDPDGTGPLTAPTDRLAELKAFYAHYPNLDAAGITKTSGTACEDTYQIKQWSNGCMTDSCSAADTATFDELGSYDNMAWKEVVAATPVYNENIKAGLEVSISFAERVVSDEEFDPYADNTQLEPVRIELSFIYEPFNEFPNIGEIPLGKSVRKMTKARQSGFDTLQQYLGSGVYEVWGTDYQNPALRRVFDSNRRKQVDRTAPYRYYYLQFKVDRGNKNWDQKSEVVEVVFAIPFTRPDKMAKLEAAILAPLASFGVALKKRDYAV